MKTADIAIRFHEEDDAKRMYVELSTTFKNHLFFREGQVLYLTLSSVRDSMKESLLLIYKAIDLLGIDI